MATLADVMRDSGNLAAAESLYEKSLAGLENSLGASHPETLRVLYEYSLLRKGQRQDIAARRLAFQLVAGAPHACSKSSRPCEISATARFASIALMPIKRGRSGLLRLFGCLVLDA